MNKPIFKEPFQLEIAVLIGFLSIAYSMIILSESYNLIIVVVSAYFFFVLLRYWEYIPVTLLPFIWYIPSFTAPGSPLEKYIFFRWFGIFSIAIISTIQIVRNLLIEKLTAQSIIGIPIFAFALISTVSALVNGQGVVKLLGYLVLYLQYPIFYIFLVNLKISRNVCKVFLFMFFFLILIQIPEIIFRYMMLGVTGDIVSVTLGSWGTYNIGIFSIYAVSLITGYVIVKRALISYITMISLLLLVGIIGEIKILIISTPIVSIVTLLFGFVHNKKSALRLFILEIITIAAVLLSYYQWGNIYEDKNYLYQFIENIYKVIINMDFNRRTLSTINRIGSFVVLYEYLMENKLALIIGMGPGSSFVGNFYGNPGKLLHLMHGSYPVTQITATLADVGVLGLFSYYWIFFRFFKFILIAIKCEHDYFNSIVFYGTFGIFVFYTIIGPVYSIVWRNDTPSYVFYFLMAYMYNYKKSQGNMNIVEKDYKGKNSLDCKAV